jgi:hypothetical protein
MDLIPGLAISEENTEALRAAILALLADEWQRPSAGLVAPDLVLDFCAQYILNSRRRNPSWGPETLVEEYLRQMQGENWATVRRVAEKPRRGSATTKRLFLALVGAAARRRDRPPMGTAKAMALVLFTYARALVHLGDAGLHPLPLPLRHGDLRRIRLDPEDEWGCRVTRAALRRHVEAGGLAQGPSMLHAWRVALVAVAVARRGAVALARARREDEVTRGSLEQALGAVEEHLLRDGQLWALLEKTPLVRNIALRFLDRRACVATLLRI